MKPPWFAHGIFKRMTVAIPIAVVRCRFALVRGQTHNFAKLVRQNLHLATPMGFFIVCRILPKDIADN